MVAQMVSPTRNRLNGSKKGSGPPMGHPDPHFGGPEYTHITPTSPLSHAYLTPTPLWGGDVVGTDFSMHAL